MFKAGMMSETDELMDKLAKEDDGMTTTQIVQILINGGKESMNLYITRPKNLPFSN